MLAVRCTVCMREKIQLSTFFLFFFGFFFFFRSWLDDNEASAVKKLKKSLPLRKELERLKFELSHQLQLSDIR